MSPFTVEPRFNEPLYNEVLGITNEMYVYVCMCEMYGTEPRYNEPRCNEILVTTNTIQLKPKRKMYPNIKKKCQHVTKDKSKMDRQG